jgi:hypothetical protein
MRVHEDSVTLMDNLFIFNHKLSHSPDPDCFGPKGSPETVFRILVTLARTNENNPFRVIFGTRGQKTWLSELYKEREYIKSSIQVLQNILVQ